MRKRLLAIIATLAMVLAMMPSMVFGAETVTNLVELQEALADESVTEINVTDTIVIPKGETVNIDLKGKTISGICDSSEDSIFSVSNTATLNIEDSSSDKSGKITFAAGSSNVGDTIDVKGKLNLYSGTIELTGSWSIGYAVDVRPNSWGEEYTEGTVFHMYGGKLVSSDAGVRVASSSDATHENVSASFIMDGGEIDAAWDGIFVQQSNEAYDILSVMINDGTISSDLAPIRIYGPNATSVLGNAENPIDIEIKGGNFEFTGTDSGKTWLVPNVFMYGGGMTTDEIANKASIEISGGTFDGDVSAYLKDGVKQDGNGNVVCAHNETKVVGAKDATCTEDGYTGDTVCEDCEVIIEEGSEIPATGHEKTEVVDAKDATCTEDGYTGDTVCAACGELIEEGAVIEALGHKYENGVCVCGAEELTTPEEPIEDPIEDPTIDTKEPAEEPTTPEQPAEEPTIDTEEPAEEAEDAVGTGDSMNVVIPFAIAALALAAMAAVVTTRRRHN